MLWDGPLKGLGMSKISRTNFSAIHLAVIFLLIAIISRSLSAQVDRTSLTGTIQDSTARPVPGVSVSAVHLNTGLSRATTTDSRGAYTIADFRQDSIE